MTLKTLLLGSLLSFLSLTSVLGQQPAGETEEAAYVRVVNERAAKIVSTLEIIEPAKQAAVQAKIAHQYRSLNAIHESHKRALKNLKETATAATMESGKAKLATETATKLKSLHVEYISALQSDLSSAQIDQVKDGMTYGVLPITYKGYQAMLPDLTAEQKQQILAYLTEARERAMDEGSSKEKHAMFGKYKGRINNYLSAAGIDMKKASKEWEARIEQEAKSRQNKN